MTGSPQQKAARISKMQRIAGAEASTKARMAEADMKAENWWGICRICGETVKGTLENLQKHAEKHDDKPRT